MPVSRTFRVFISSSFQDMHQERDYLNNYCFSVLDAELMARGYRLQAFDLRGSTAGGSPLVEEAVLHMCLQGVDDCRPRFIGLLGDRYGWVPYDTSKPADITPATRLAIENLCHNPDLAISEEEMDGVSITHIEIRYGLKRVPHQNCFFYNRQLPMAQLGDAFATYVSGREQQEAMKAEIAASLGPLAGERMRDYAADWDEENSQVSGLQPLCEMVLADLRASIFAEIAEREAEGEQAESEDFLLLQKTQHTSPAPQLPQLREMLCGDGADAVLLTGPAGSGKSTLAAQLAAQLREEGWLVIGHSCSARQDSHFLAVMLENLCAQLRAGLALDGGDLDSLLEQAAGRKVLVLMDGLEAMEQTEEVRQFAWLPGAMPHVRYLCTAWTAAAFACPRVAAFDLAPVHGDGSIQDMLIAMAGRFGKRFEEGVLLKAAEHVEKSTALPLYAKILAEYLMTMTDAEYHAYTGADAHLQWMHRQIATFPPGVEGAYGKLRSRGRAAFGGELFDTALELLAITRFGLRDLDLRACLDQLLERAVEERELYALRGYLSGHLQQGMGADWWNFAHGQFRAAIWADVPAARRVVLHRTMLRYLQGLGSQDVYAFENLLWHAYGADDPEAGADFLLQHRLARQVWHTVQAYYARYFTDIMRDDRQAGAAFLAALLRCCGAYRADEILWVYNLVMDRFYDDSLTRGVFTLEEYRPLVEAMRPGLEGWYAEQAQDLFVHSYYCKLLLHTMLTQPDAEEVAAVARQLIARAEDGLVRFQVQQSRYYNYVATGATYLVAAALHEGDAAGAGAEARKLEVRLNGMLAGEFITPLQYCYSVARLYCRLARELFESDMYTACLYDRHAVKMATTAMNEGSRLNVVMLDRLVAGKDDLQEWSIYDEQQLAGKGHAFMLDLGLMQSREEAGYYYRATLDCLLEALARITCLETLLALYDSAVQDTNGLIMLRGSYQKQFPFDYANTLKLADAYSESARLLLLVNQPADALRGFWGARELLAELRENNPGPEITLRYALACRDAGHTAVMAGHGESGQELLAEAERLAAEGELDVDVACGPYVDIFRVHHAEAMRQMEAGNAANAVRQLMLVIRAMYSHGRQAPDFEGFDAEEAQLYLVTVSEFLEHIGAFAGEEGTAMCHVLEEHATLLLDSVVKEAELLQNGAMLLFNYALAVLDCPVPPVAALVNCVCAAALLQQRVPEDALGGEVQQRALRLMREGKGCGERVLADMPQAMRAFIAAGRLYGGRWGAAKSPAAEQAMVYTLQNGPGLFLKFARLATGRGLEQLFDVYNKKMLAPMVAFCKEAELFDAMYDYFGDLYADSARMDDLGVDFEELVFAVAMMQNVYALYMPQGSEESEQGMDSFFEMLEWLAETYPENRFYPYLLSGGMQEEP